MKHLSFLYPIVVLFLLGFHVSAQSLDTIRTARLTLHGQTTVISQHKLNFGPVPYTGDNSLHPEAETQTSLTSTIFAGARLWRGAAVYFNPEIAGGSGLSQALGLADAPNGETFRIGDPSPKLYVARLFFQQIIACSSSVSRQESDANQLEGTIPDRYVSITVGKVGIADFFDHNSYSHDPRTQFMCWGLMDNGAWDYPANTRGYAPSVVLEWIKPDQAWRLGISLLPKTANGPQMNWQIQRSNSTSLEYTRNFAVMGKPGALRLMAFYNTTNMGDYRKALGDAPINPNVADTRAYGRNKYGFAFNAEQQLGAYLGAFARASWNDGKHETWCFTEIDHSASAGISLNGQRWKRPDDHFGMAGVVSGLSKPHRDYLQAGGKGFMLGDGSLKYKAEYLMETYYSCALRKHHFYISGAYQLVYNPGYNGDRSGPVHIFSFRLHSLF